MTSKNKWTYHSIFLAILPLLNTTVNAAVSDMPYVNIVAQNSQKCLDIPTSSMTDGAQVSQMTCKGKPTEVWKVVAVTPTQYQIISNNTGMCLDLDGASSKNGAFMQQSACAGIHRKNQIWQLVPITNGYQVISASSGKCLDVTNRSTADNTPIQQWDCNSNGQDNQTWKLTAVEPGLTASPPLTITTSNTTISGVKITNANGPCIMISGKSGAVSNVTIKNSDIGPCANPSSSNYKTDGNGIFIDSSYVPGNVSGVTVNNVNFHDIQGNGLALYSSFTAANSSENILTVTNSLFTNITNQGIYISFAKPAPTDGVPAISAISFTNLKMQNIPTQSIFIYGTNSAFVENNTFMATQSGVNASASEGVRVNNNNFYHFKPNNLSGKSAYGSFVQFNGVFGANNAIACNVGLQDNYGTPQSKDGISDEISVYSSSGTAQSPLLVVGNKLMGGGAPLLKSDDVGSGITVGDGNGGAYINVIDNVLVNVGHGGLMGAGGDNIQLTNNKIFSVANPVNFFGLGFVNYAGLYNGGPCTAINVQNNRVNWTNQYGPDTQGWINPVISGSTLCSNFVWKNNTFQDATITPALFDSYMPSECPMI
ncbi:MAG: ricin-type beta-trefoil lectin domain protein [Gammaproteobacteria bacterium]|nr:ricin-type beta-trefoil lectin domain protein [Gammaproteobacteria bacterium]